MSLTAPSLWLPSPRHRCRGSVLFSHLEGAEAKTCFSSLVRTTLDLVSTACKDEGARFKKKTELKLHPGMYARSFFKAGFYAEMGSDFSAAVKYAASLHCERVV